MDEQGVAEQVDRGARNSGILEAAVRVGLLAYGVVHLLVAWVAVRLTLGSGAGSATGNGALAQLAGGTGGKVTLVAMALGFAALVLWQVLVAAVGFRDRNGWSRILMRLGAAFARLPTLTSRSRPHDSCSPGARVQVGPRTRRPRD